MFIERFAPKNLHMSKIFRTFARSFACITKTRPIHDVKLRISASVRYIDIELLLLFLGNRNTTNFSTRENKRKVHAERGLFVFIYV